MTKLLAAILKALPFVGGFLIAAAVVQALRSGGMDQTRLAMIGLGFALFLAMFLHIEAASLRYYANLSILAVLFAAVLTVAYLLIANHDRRWDMTRGGRKSLSTQTVEILQSLSNPVNIELFATENEPYSSYLQLYADASSAVSFTISNPYRRMALPEDREEKVEVNDMWITSGERKTRLPFPADANLWALENDLLNAIFSVAQAERPRIYFTANHGEKSLNAMPDGSKADQTISRFATALHDRNLELRAGLDLEVDRLVPDDCAVLVIFGPQVDFSDAEVDAVRRYLTRGGALFAALDPPVLQRNELPRLRQLLERFGVEVSRDIVIDYESYSEAHNHFVPMVKSFSPVHDITTDLAQAGVSIPFHRAREVDRAEPAPQDMTFQRLALTSAKSWTVDIDEYRAALLGGGNLQGPPSSEWRVVSLALCAEPRPDAQPLPSGFERPRLVVFGDSDFLTDALLRNEEATLGYYALTWLADDDELVRLPPREIEKSPMRLTPQQKNLISIISVVAVPFSIFFGGLGYTTIRRRRR